MSYVKERLQRFQSGVGVLSKELPETTKGLLGLVGNTLKDGALSVREKELVCIGIALYTRCEDCIIVHAKNALDAGCTRAEILEAAGVAMTFGGGPSLGASASLLVEALDEFEKEIK